jgi:hypothetical protein
VKYTVFDTADDCTSKIKSKNPKHPAVKREAEEDWGK